MKLGISTVKINTVSGRGYFPTDSAKLGYEVHSLVDKRTEIQLGEVSSLRPQSEVDIRAEQDILTHWAASHHIVAHCSETGHLSQLCEPYFPSQPGVHFLLSFPTAIAWCQGFVTCHLGHWQQPAIWSLARSLSVLSVPTTTVKLI